MVAVDYHVHSNYSDGDLLYRMVAAADRAGLDAVGIADHCHVSGDETLATHRDVFGFNLDITYERRRRGIRHVASEFDLDVYDAVEMDYLPDERADIDAFLDGAGFDYAIGSVHQVDGRNVQDGGAFRDASERERQAVVDRYFEVLVDLVDSELFDIAAHLDLVERTGPLRGYATQEHYDRVAEALAASRTVPEVNAGRALRDYGEFHPNPAFLSTLLEHDVAFVVGTDSHSPEEIETRSVALDDLLGDVALEPTTLDC